MDSVKEVVDEIIQNPELEDWGINLSSQPFEFDSRILQKPYLITGGPKEKIEIMDKNSFNNPIL